MADRVVVAMSGGVDSSVAAARLVDEGHEVIGVTLRLWDRPEPVAASAIRAPDPIRDAQRVAEQLGFQHRVLDCRAAFSREIVGPFVEGYLSGRTPSPCAVCNQRVKIPPMQQLAQRLGADAVATGHYARVVPHGSGFRIARGVDGSKDQSYFLCTLGSATLGGLQLPLGADTKDEIRREAIARGLAVAHRRESQDLCFVPDGDYVRFVSKRAGSRVRTGRIVDAAGRELAVHDGIHRFTLGQRKGLGVALGYPVFVSHIDPNSGDVTVADEASVRTHRVVVDEPVIAFGASLPMRAHVRVRYRHAGAAALLTRAPHGALEIAFERPVRAASPGQFAVAYIGQEVVAGGMIASVDCAPIASDPGSVSQ